MHLVERMTQAPPQCLVCGVGNTPDGETGKVGPFLDMERDVNWGDPAYLCEGCGSKIGAMFGMISSTDREDLEQKVKGLEQKIHNLEGEMDMRRAREAEALRKSRARELLEA